MKQKPFFAKFLEDQIPARTQKETKGGCDCGPDLSMTLKAPSDMEEGINATNASIRDVAEEFFEPQTMKYPSDCEEH